MDKKILVVGLGTTGLSIVNYLNQAGMPLMVYDTRANPPKVLEFQKMFPTIPVYLENYPASLLDRVSKIITSPGVLPSSAIFQEAKILGIPIESDLDCLTGLVNAPIIGITGSNGKSTVTTLVGEMLIQQGLKVAVGGNLGTPVLDLYAACDTYDAWVLELSSFQLLKTRHIALKAASILNVSPDHIDYHGSLEAYTEAKHLIYKNANCIVYNREDVATYPKKHDKPMISFGLSAPGPRQWGIVDTPNGPAIAYENDIWVHTNDLNIKGKHHWQNIMAAIALAREIGVSKDTIQSVLKIFSGLKHRTQTICTHADVTYINDSKGTNLGASLAAIEGIGPTISGRILLIAGGQGKGADFKPMRLSLEKYVRKVFLIGQDAKCLENDWQDSVEIMHCQNLAQAVYHSKTEAKSGDVVLLSPACASFDMFHDYQDRGEQFVQLVQDMFQ